MRNLLNVYLSNLGVNQDDINKALNLQTGYVMGKRLTVSELKKKQIGDMVWLRFKGGAIPQWRIDEASEIDDIFEDGNNYEISFMDYDFHIDNNLKDSDENLDSQYGIAYICEAIKK